MISSACSRCGRPVGPELLRCEERFRSVCPFELKQLRPPKGSSGCLAAMGTAALAVGTWLALLMARGFHADHPLAIAVQGAFTGFVLLLGLLLLLGGLYGPLGRIRLAVDMKAGAAYREGRLFGIAVERAVLVAQPPVAVPEWTGGLPASLAWLEPDDPAELSRTVERAVQAARVRDPLARSRFESKAHGLHSEAPQLLATVLLSLAARGRIRLRRVERECAYPLRRRTERATTIHVSDLGRPSEIGGVLERKLLAALSGLRAEVEEPFGPSVRQVVEALFPSLVANPGRDLILDVRREARSRGLVREAKGRDVPHPPPLEEGLMVRIAGWIEDRISFWVEEPGAAASLEAERERLVALRDATQDVDPALLHDLGEEIRAALAARESSD